MLYASKEDLRRLVILGDDLKHRLRIGLLHDAATATFEIEFSAVRSPCDFDLSCTRLVLATIDLTFVQDHIYFPP
jgi:hypothetical protein